MTSSRTSQEIFDREFLEIRAKLLELAASFDRLERGSGEMDERSQLIARGLEILSDPADGKAERIQVLFSREYSADWRDEFGL
ncbi:MAG: hypothetical protein ACR2NP_19450 [Pirellulaceae bacterium]